MRLYRDIARKSFVNYPVRILSQLIKRGQRCRNILLYGSVGSENTWGANGSGSLADVGAVRDCGCGTSGGRGLRSPPAIGGVTLSDFGFSETWAAPSRVC